MKQFFPTGALCAAVFVLVPFSSHAALYDRGGGLIYDDVLDVTWLQDADYARTQYNNSGGLSGDADGKMTWAAANSWVSGLSYFDSVRGVSYDDWRLPIMSPVNGVAFDLNNSFDGSTDNGYNITSPASELSYMYHVNLGGVSLFDTAGNLQYDAAGIADPSPFSGISGGVWSQTEVPTDTTTAFVLGMGNGHQNWFAKDTEHYTWAVRDGDVAAVPVPAALWLFSSGLLVFGARVKTSGCHAAR